VKREFYLNMRQVAKHAEHSILVLLKLMDIRRWRSNPVGTTTTQP